MGTTKVETTQFAGWLIWSGLCLVVTAVAGFLFRVAGDTEGYPFLAVAPIPYAMAAVFGLFLQEPVAKLAGVLAYVAILLFPPLNPQPRTGGYLGHLISRGVTAHVAVTLVVLACGTILCGAIALFMLGFPVG